MRQSTILGLLTALLSPGLQANCLTIAMEQLESDYRNGTLSAQDYNNKLVELTVSPPDDCGRALRSEMQNADASGIPSKKSPATLQNLGPGQCVSGSKTFDEGDEINDLDDDLNPISYLCEDGAWMKPCRVPGVLTDYAVHGDVVTGRSCNNGDWLGDDRDGDWRKPCKVPWIKDQYAPHDQIEYGRRCEHGQWSVTAASHTPDTLCLRRSRVTLMTSTL